MKPTHTHTHTHTQIQNMASSSSSEAPVLETRSPVEERLGERLTTRNASKLTTYELRQELTRRGAFDLEDSTVNFKTMLARLMRELVDQEAKEQEAAVAAKVEEHKSEADKAKDIREQRKQEALERSKQRQADKAYFEAKLQANSEAQERIKEKKAENSATEPAIDEEDSSQERGEADPFRLVPTGRSKVFVK
jgi:membrane protein involved in colicin uptake